MNYFYKPNLEDKLLSMFFNTIDTYYYLFFPFIGIFVFFLFINTTKQHELDISLKKYINSFNLHIVLVIIVISLSLFILKNFNIKLENQVYIFLLIQILLFLYAVYKMFFKIKNKDNTIIIAKQNSYSNLVNKIDKTKFRKSNQIQTSLPFYVIKHSLKKQIKQEHMFVKIYKNNINLISKIKILDTFLNKEKKIKTLAKKTKVNRLNPLQKEIIRITIASYKTIDNNRKILSVENRIKDIKFPISRLKLDYIIFQEYKKSLKSYINPMMNFSWLIENELDKELLGACQNASMLKLQPYGYLYYKIFIDIENYIILDKNKKVLLSKLNTITINKKNKFYQILENYFKKFDKNFNIQIPKKRLELDKQLFNTYKSLLNIKIDKLEKNHIKMIEEIKEVYQDKDTTNKEIKELEEKIKNTQNRDEIEKLNKTILDLKSKKEEFIKNLKGEPKLIYETEMKEQERKNLILKKLEEDINNLNFPVSKIELDIFITKQYNKMRLSTNQTPIPLFLDTLFNVSKNILDKELVGSFQNLHNENFDSLGYTYYKILTSDEKLTKS